ncbi:hypothetical protein [Chryseobacterium sp. MEBOG07]|uniref:hypothetical protein n=1 Tax=Chryseobacterium sp. MEBOG07 TaxID=2879939 RepID=UPI001F2545FC|nr:hypothetical protein [Chryseobacterium sp. MEBOG07]UKB79562.1 hypothetical protein LF886_00715 [Chryseobacterium sp. MEBOG07]
MSIRVNIDVPDKDNGFWLITDFLECFKHSDHHIWVKIEIVHVIYDLMLEKYIFGDRIVNPYPLQYMMYITAGDEFDLEGRGIKKKRLKTLEWNIVTKPDKLEMKVYNHLDFLNLGDSFPLNCSSDGMLYYDLFDYDKKDNEKVISQKNVIILPASVIGQFFYFLESDFSNLLYSINLKYIFRNYNRENIEYRDGLKIGKFFYEWEQCKNDNVLSAASNFLFSKNDQLIKALYNSFNQNLRSVYHNPYKIPFHYKIPIDAELKLKVRGNYFKDKYGIGIFLIKEILDFETKGSSMKNLFTVDKIEYHPDIEYSLKGLRKPEDAIGRPSIKNQAAIDSLEIYGSYPSNSSFKPRNMIQEKKRFGDIIPVEKYSDRKSTVQLITDKIIIENKISDGDSLHPENGEKDSKKRSIKTSTENTENSDNNSRNEEKTKTYLKEVIKVFTMEFDDFKVYSFYYVLGDNTRIDFVEINKKDTDKFVYFIDAFGQRLQVIYHITLSRYSEKELKNVIDSVKNHNFNSWLPWRKSNYAFEGMEFGVSINRGVDNNADYDFYKKESEKIFERIMAIISS